MLFDVSRAWVGTLAVAVVALVLSCAVASTVRAHAPAARAVALTADGAAIAVALPGFGVLVRKDSTAAFGYLCDAALGQEPGDTPAPMAFVADGSLLVGTRQGVRIVAPDGCPASDEPSTLSNVAIVALAAQPGTDVVYAATGGDLPGMWRSVDGGRAWEKRSSLANAELVSSLHVHPDDADRLYLSVEPSTTSTTSTASTVLASTDAGATFESLEQERVLTLLGVQGGTTTRLWALTRSADNTTNRGFDLLRADAAAGPWSFAARVEYFGGFAIDAQARIWIGDEAGGVHRSDDGGDSFVDTAPEQAVACLAGAGDALWACAPGTNLEPALIMRAVEAESFSSVVAFADVDHLVECDVELDVPNRCAAAWVEWRRDVRMEDLAAGDGGAADAGEGADAGAEAGTEVEGDADAAPPPQVGQESSGCNVSRPVGSVSTNAMTTYGWAGLLLPLMLAGRLVRRRRA